MVVLVTWDAENPPLEPPEGCLHPRLWRLASELYWAHTPKKNGVCGACEVRWPCQGSLWATRAMIDSCMHSPIPRSDGAGWDVIETGTCKWCGLDIELRPSLGWMHVWVGLYICKQPCEGSPPYCSAEPA